MSLAYMSVIRPWVVLEGGKKVSSNFALDAFITLGKTNFEENSLLWKTANGIMDSLKSFRHVLANFFFLEKNAWVDDLRELKQMANRGKEGGGSISVWQIAN